MPVSRRRTSTASSAARRELRRRRTHATIRRMVDQAERRVEQRAAEAGRKYCIVCPGSRMRPFKVNRQVVENLVECRRCGRRETVAYLIAHNLVTAEFEKLHAAIDAQEQMINGSGADVPVIPPADTGELARDLE